jgi:hypothetical protein
MVDENEVWLDVDIPTTPTAEGYQILKEYGVEVPLLAENPYWHPEVKPHFFDTDKVEELCLIAFEAFATSSALCHEFINMVGDDDFTHPGLIGKHREKAEARISSVLLTLSITFRALEEGLEDGNPVKQFIDRNLNEQQLHWLTPEDGKTSLREVCNKIIHAKDISPVYGYDGQATYGGAWVMEGTIELKGEYRNPWHVSFVLPDFLEAILDVSKLVAPLNKEAS